MTTDDTTPTTGSTRSIEARIARAGLPPLPRQAWLEVDLDVLAANAHLLRSLLPNETLLGIVVKADGYGHGLEAAARAAVTGGADVLLVATLDEALILRAAGFRQRVLVLYPVPADAIWTAADAGVEVVAADEASVGTIAGWLRGDRATTGPSGSGPASPTLRVHLGIDSGMGRGGLAAAAAPGAARRLLDAGLPSLAGTWSHLASPEDPAATAAQVSRFEAALAGLAAGGIDPGLRHLDATGGLLGGGGPSYDLVRVGLAYYGLVQPELAVPETPPELRRIADALRPALSLRARAATVTTVPAGWSVGYAGTWTAARSSVIATVPVGYADGWKRAYAPGSWAVTRGVRVPLVGRVSSDALALDVTDVPGFGPDDEIVLIGSRPASGRATDGAGTGPAATAPMTVTTSPRCEGRSPGRSSTT